MTEKSDLSDLTEAERLFKEATEYHNKVSDRWSLSIAVANGGGMLAVATALISNEITRPLAEVLILSAWLFSAGVVLIGVGQSLAVISSAYTAHGFQGLIARYINTGSSNWWGKQAFYDWLYWSQVVCEVLAGAAFVVGIGFALMSYPMPAA